MKGSIIKRGSTYSIIFDMGRDRKGKRQQKWVGGFRTKKEAEIALNKKIYEVNNDLYFDYEKRTLEEYLKDWYKDYVKSNLATNTARGYLVNIERHILPEIGHIPLNKLQPIHIQQLYNKKLQSGLSATTVIYIHRVLHKALQQALKLQIINRNVTDSVELPRKKKYEAVFLNENQVKKMLSLIKETDIYIPVLLAVSLGLRRGEVLGLKWQDIDYHNKTISVFRTAVRETKGNVVLAPTKTERSKRTIAISDKLIKELKLYKEMQGKQKIQFQEIYIDNDLVICREDGSPFSPTVLNKRFTALLIKNNLPKIRFHDLRHTNATLMLKHRIPAKVASERLGHSSIGITLDLYSHVVSEMQKEASMIFDNII